MSSINELLKENFCYSQMRFTYCCTSRPTHLGKPRQYANSFVCLLLPVYNEMDFRDISLVTMIVIGFVLLTYALLGCKLAIFFKGYSSYFSHIFPRLGWFWGWGIGVWVLNWVFGVRLQYL